MRVLVTGAGGFLGAQIVQDLARNGHDVLALMRSPDPSIRWASLPDADKARITPVIADLNHWPGDDGIPPDFAPDACVHLAWYARPGHYLQAFTENQLSLQAAVRLTRSLALHGKTRRLIVAGTCLEREAVTGVANSHYAAAKHAARTILGPLCRQAGISLSWMRIFYLHGPWEDPNRLIPQLIRGLARGAVVPLSPGLQKRDYLHLSDVSAAFLTALNAPDTPDEEPVSACHEIGSGQAVSIRDLALRLADQFQRPDLLDFGARPAPLNEPAVIQANPASLNALGWRPALSLDEGLNETRQWWMSHQDLWNI